MAAARTVRLAEAEPQATAVVALVTTWAQFPAQWGPLLSEVWEAIRAQGARAGRNVMLYRDDRPAVEVGVELLGPFQPGGRVTTSALPQGPTATTTEPGPPTADGIAAAHERILNWCREHNQPLTTTRWEIYSHHSDDPSQMHVEVHYALATPA
jgi:hypothetical protein